MKTFPLLALACLALCCSPSFADEKKPASRGFTITETTDEIQLNGDTLDAVIRKKGYVSGVPAGSLLDKKTGARDLGFGLDIVDWIMEPGSDEAYRNQLPADLPDPDPATSTTVAARSVLRAWQPTPGVTSDRGG